MSSNPSHPKDSIPTGTRYNEPQNDRLNEGRYRVKRTGLRWGVFVGTNTWPVFTSLFHATAQDVADCLLIEFNTGMHIADCNPRTIVTLTKYPQLLKIFKNDYQIRQVDHSKM